MAKATRISNVAAKALCDAIVAKINGGAGAGKVQIWNGTQAAGPDTAVADDDTPYSLLAEVTLNDPSHGAAADGNPGGVATADVDPALVDASANKTGTASWFRTVDSDGNAVIDGTVGTADADMIVPTTSVVAGQPFSITSWTITMPES